MQPFAWWFNRLAFLGAATVLFFTARNIPHFGDPDASAATHVSPRYIEKAKDETGAHNMVTAVLADYRSYDTLGETVVIFTAGMACLMVLGVFENGRHTFVATKMFEPFGSNIIDAAARMLLPFILTFAAYVVVHGHDSPGGGFQGGAICAAAIILFKLIRPESKMGLPIRQGIILSCTGLLIYVGIGLLGLLAELNYLDYAALPFDKTGGELRAYGSLGIELGVFLTVTGILSLIFQALFTGAKE